MKKLCPHCEKETEINLVTAREHINVRGESIDVPVEYCQCIECQVSFENTRGLDSLDLAYFERLKNSHIDNFESHPEELVKRMSHGDCALFLLEILIARRDADAIGDIISAWILREAAYIARVELPPRGN